MNRFPDPLQLPKEVPIARQERVEVLVRSSTRGIIARLLVATVELVASVAFGSAALFMDALATAIDIATSIFLIFSFKFADRPPDRNHPFGHGRLEPLAGLQLGILLVVVGVGMAAYQFSNAVTEEHVLISPYLWIIPLGATVLFEICYQFMMRSANKQHSPALAADAWHYRVDGVTSLVAAIALILVAFLPNWGILIDHLGASFISIMMVVTGAKAARKNLNQLIDAIPEEGFFEKVKCAAMRVNGVFATEKIRIQHYGPDAHVNIDIEVEPALTVEKAHEISQQVRVEIQKEWPFVRDVIVHIEPYYPNDH
ncbi:Uncharacterized protein PHSC3_000291 [Chlamydiales bacterium STE3]|nr:Uncharacterized protein PHSC3_000291 [Chlamydiales bacterium STE3]